jgi:hypothetical protein
MLRFHIRISPAASVPDYFAPTHRLLFNVTGLASLTWLVIGTPLIGIAQGLVVPPRVIIEEFSLSGALDRAAIEESLEPLTGARLIYAPKSDSSCCAAEPYSPGDRRYPQDPESVGYNRASLIVDSKWATIRYLGESPVGQGANDEALNALIRNGLGRPNDILPVTTAVYTINEMMERYFSPLLRSLPQGKAVLEKLHIDGAYFSPTLRFAEGRDREFDNAFVVGLQSLMVFPSSCFNRPNYELCRDPFLSTGHDPTVMGHELGHAVFNYLMQQDTLKGFQWFAVNEGYADYFSASFFRTAAIGQSWQSARTRAPYLRRLSDHPTIRDPEVLKSAHTFGTVWSSLLWEIRKELGRRFQNAEFEFDRAVLLSITHLGEGGGARLGDAARALLKSTYELGYPQWDRVIREQMAASEIQISSEQLALVPEGPAADSQGFGCSSGSGSKKSSGTDPSDNQISALPVSHAGLDFGLTFLFGILATALCSCIPWQRKDSARKFTELVSLQKPFASYDCDLGALSGTSLDHNPSPVSLAFSSKEPGVTNQAGGESKNATYRVFVFDPVADRTDLAVQILVDGENLRVDRALKIDGSPAKVSLGSNQIGVEPAVQLAYISLATMLFESAPLASKSAVAMVKTAGSASSVEAPPSDVSFAMGLQGTFSAIYERSREPVSATAGVELPRRITRSGALVCTWKD